MRFTHIISLGGDCAPSWQSRKFTGNEIGHTFDWMTAYPFDWMLLPFKSLVGILRTNFSSLTDNRNFAPITAPIWDPKLRIRNSVHPLLYWHDFTYPITTQTWSTELASVIVKYQFLVRRWQRLMLDPNSRILFVRHYGHIDSTNFTDTTDITLHDIETLCLLLTKICCNPNWEIVFVNACNNIPNITRTNLHFETVSLDASNDWPDPTVRWRGPVNDWQAIFNKIAG